MCDMSIVRKYMNKFVKFSTSFAPNMDNKCIYHSIFQENSLNSRHRSTPLQSVLAHQLSWRIWKNIYKYKWRKWNNIFMHFCCWYLTQLGSLLWVRFHYFSQLQQPFGKSMTKRIPMDLLSVYVPSQFWIHSPSIEGKNLITTWMEIWSKIYYVMMICW